MLAADSDVGRRERSKGEMLEIRRIAVEIAVQWIGPSGTTLINEDDIAMGANAAVPRKPGRQFCRRLTRTASEHEDRIWRVVPIKGWENHDVQTNLSSRSVIAVFPHRIRGTINFFGHVWNVASVRSQFDGEDGDSMSGVSNVYRRRKKYETADDPRVNIEHDELFSIWRT
jgi:hypothetical protein